MYYVGTYHYCCVHKKIQYKYFTIPILKTFRLYKDTDIQVGDVGVRTPHRHLSFIKYNVLNVRALQRYVKKK